MRVEVSARVKRGARGVEFPQEWAGVKVMCEVRAGGGGGRRVCVKSGKVSC